MIFVRKTILAIVLAFTLSGFSQRADIPARKGWWDFNDTLNPLAPVAGTGLPLELVGSHSITGGPVDGDYAVSIGVGSYYRMTHQIAGNGGGSYVNEYTLQFDFKVESLGNWYCFFQTNPQNSNDGDCFINPYGNIGVAATSYTTDVISAGQWYRLVIAADNGSRFTYYLDGVPVNQAIIQEIDGRFALDPLLLLFADENGEDNTIIVSQVAIWDQPLTDDQVAELGGFTHPVPPDLPMLTCYPFLQAMTQNSVIVCWHDTLADLSRVSYGPTSALGSQATGSSEIVMFPYRWHSVKLTGLQPATKYYYRLESGSGNSEISSFTTLPGNSYKGHIRFLLFSDSQTDSAASGFVVRSARDKVNELYGGDLDDNINLIMHTGDITGYGPTISIWTSEFFMPFRPLSANIPFMSVAGNHEMEHQNYYTYVKYDDFSAFPDGNALFEKVWAYRMPRILFLGISSSIADVYGDTEIAWLDQSLQAAENDTTIDFVFCFMHHPPVSEIWGEGNTAFVNDEVLPVLQKYSKVQQLSYGHTHAFERGVIESKAPNANGDFRISCVGGGGGATDRWGVYTNYDYPQIHIGIDHYFYVLYDIDLGNSSFEATMYDLGNSNIPPTNTPGDQWHRRLKQPAPDRPVALEPTPAQNGQVTLHASLFSGADEMMSSRFQLTNSSGQYDSPLLDQTRNWQDIYGTDSQFMPVDLNAATDLTSLEVPSILLEDGKKYYFRVRYRDQNLKWSEWSDEKSFKYSASQGIVPGDGNTGDMLRMMPNPFHESAVIRFSITCNQNVKIEIKDLNGRVIAVPVNGYYKKDTYDIPLHLEGIKNGFYLCTMTTETDTYIIKLEAGI